MKLDGVAIIVQLAQCIDDEHVLIVGHPIVEGLLARGRNVHNPVRTEADPHSHISRCKGEAVPTGTISKDGTVSNLKPFHYLVANHATE